MGPVWLVFLSEGRQCSQLIQNSVRFLPPSSTGRDWFLPTAQQAAKLSGGRSLSSGSGRGWTGTPHAQCSQPHPRWATTEVAKSWAHRPERWRSRQPRKGKTAPRGLPGSSRSLARVTGGSRCSKSAEVMWASSSSTGQHPDTERTSPPESEHPERSGRPALREAPGHTPLLANSWPTMACPGKNFTCLKILLESRRLESQPFCGAPPPNPQPGEEPNLSHTHLSQPYRRGGNTDSPPGPYTLADCNGRLILDFVGASLSPTPLPWCAQKGPRFDKDAQGLLA